MSLALTERNELEKAEQVIQRGMSTFVEVGLALKKIRDERLYRADYPNFQSYCQDRWHWTSGRANQLIASSAVAEQMTTSGSQPKTERQVRELLKLKSPEERRAVYDSASESRGGDPTAADIKRAASRRRDPAEEEAEILSALTAALSRSARALDSMRTTGALKRALKHADVKEIRSRLLATAAVIDRAVAGIEKEN